MEDNAYEEFASNTLGHLLVANNNWYPDVSSHGNPKHLLSLPKNNNLADFRQI